MILGKLILINHWFHLSAAALLVGGMIFLVAILRPVLGRSSSVSGIGTFANDVHERFRIYVGILVGYLLLLESLIRLTALCLLRRLALVQGIKLLCALRLHWRFASLLFTV